ncbi:F-box only protein family [Trichomonas vaginalis G3]|uniref:F-box only protein family n=1 Tax=Trichomonas vaginalis (strain ATCC PRA-98 / G3) TaxID=412133 RepID=UPI0021E5E0D5|nr:F-box only protein family [Trichomonas vaginalis G3]KAI5497308.1 F-box only protein family [Trichomonas vaginalis G3]
MSLQTGAEDKIQNLEALLGLYPFDKEPENTRELENERFDKLEQLLPSVLSPDYSERNHEYTINSSQYKDAIKSITDNLKSHVDNLKGQFERSTICPDYQEQGFNLDDLYARAIQNVPGFVIYSKEKGNLNDFLNAVKTNYTVLIPPGDYVASLKLRRQINLIGLENAGKVQIIAPKLMNAITCAAPGGMIQGITFQTAEPSVYPTVEVVDGNIKIFRCTIIGSKGAAVKVSNLACASFFNCTIRESEEYVLNITDFAMAKCYNTEISNGLKSSIGLFSNSASFFNKCRISSSHDGVIIQNSASAIFRETEIYNHSKCGLVISSNSTFIKLDQCEISENSKLVADKEPGAAIYTNKRAAITIQDCKFKSNKCCILSTSQSVVSSKSNKFEDAPDSSVIDLRNESKMISESDFFSGQCKNCIHACDYATLEATQAKFFSLVQGGSDILYFHESANLILNQCIFDQIGTRCITIADKVNSIIKETTFTAVKLAIQFKGEATATVENCKFQNLNTSIQFNVASGQICISDCDFLGNNEYCIHIISSPKPHIKNCNFVGKEQHEKSSNQKNNKFVALRILEPSSEPIIENCKFNGYTYGTVITNGSHPILKSCEFSNCSISADIDNSSPSFDSCKFYIIMLDGIRITNASNSSFTNCTIEAVRNTGILIDAKDQKGSSPRFSRCNIFSASMGVDAKNEASPIFDGCTFSNNRKVSVIFSNAIGMLNECVFQDSITGIAIAVDKKATTHIKKCKVNDQTVGVFIKDGNCTIDESEIYKCKTGVRLELPPDTSFIPQIINNQIHHIYNEAVLLISGKCAIKGNEISDCSNGIIVVNKYYEMNKDSIQDNNFSNVKGQNLKVMTPKEKKEAQANDPSKGTNSGKLQQGTNSGQTLTPGLQSFPTAGNQTTLKSLPPGAGQPGAVPKIGSQAYAAFPPPGTAATSSAASGQTTAQAQIQSQYPGYAANTLRPGMFQTQVGGAVNPAYARTQTSPGGMNTGTAAFASMNPAMTGQSPYATNYKPAGGFTMQPPAYATNATMMPGGQFQKSAQVQQGNSAYASATPYTQRPAQSPAYATQTSQYQNYNQSRQGQMYPQAAANQQYQVYQQQQQQQQSQYAQQQYSQQQSQYAQQQGQQYSQQQYSQPQYPQQFAQQQYPQQYAQQQQNQQVYQQHLKQQMQQYAPQNTYNSAQQKRPDTMGPR